MVFPIPLTDGVVLRPLDVPDAPALLDAYRRNRDHLQPYEPARPDSFWTLDGQHERVRTMVANRGQARELACALWRGERLVGNLTLNSIVWGALHSADLGYWIDAEETGRGLAGAAVAAICRVADQE